MMRRYLPGASLRSEEDLLVGSPASKSSSLRVEIASYPLQFLTCKLRCYCLNISELLVKKEEKLM